MSVVCKAWFIRDKENQVFTLRKELRVLSVLKETLNIDIEEETETIVDKMQSLFEPQFVF